MTGWERRRGRLAIGVVAALVLAGQGFGGREAWAADDDDGRTGRRSEPFTQGTGDSWDTWTRGESGQSGGDQPMTGPDDGNDQGLPMERRDQGPTGTILGPCSTGYQRDFATGSCRPSFEASPGFEDERRR